MGTSFAITGVLLAIVSLVWGSRPLPGTLKWARALFAFSCVLLLIGAASTPERLEKPEPEEVAVTDIPSASVAARDVEAELEASPAPDPEPEPEPEPAPKPKWVVKDYTVAKEKDISSSNRLRRHLWIVAPTALTPESRIATLMEAAVRVHREQHPQYIGAFLLPFESSGDPMARINPNRTIIHDASASSIL